MDAVEPLLGVTVIEGLETKIDSGTGKLENLWVGAVGHSKALKKANQAILASLLQISPGARMDSDDVACINEKRNLDGCSRF